jgi:hypothetical protein
MWEVDPETRSKVSKYYLDLVYRNLFQYPLRRTTNTSLSPHSSNKSRRRQALEMTDVATAVPRHRNGYDHEEISYLVFVYSTICH